MGKRLSELVCARVVGVVVGCGWVGGGLAACTKTGLVVFSGYNLVDLALDERGRRRPGCSNDGDNRDNCPFVEFA